MVNVAIFRTLPGRDIEFSHFQITENIRCSCESETSSLASWLWVQKTDKGTDKFVNDHLKPDRWSPKARQLIRLIPDFSLGWTVRQCWLVLKLLSDTLRSEQNCFMFSPFLWRKCNNPYLLRPCVIFSVLGSMKTPYRSIGRWFAFCQKLKMIQKFRAHFGCILFVWKLKTCVYNSEQSFNIWNDLSLF